MPREPVERPRFDRERVIRGGGRSVDLFGLRLVAGDRNAADEPRHAQREDGVDVVPQSPLGQHAVGPPLAAVQPVAERVEKRIEVIVFDDEAALVGMGPVVDGQFVDHLQPQRRLAAPLFAEDDRGRRALGVSIDFVPRRVMGGVQAKLAEDVVGLGVLRTERVLRDAVMGQELLHLHQWSLENLHFRGGGDSFQGGKCGMRGQGSGTGGREERQHAKRAALCLYPDP